MLNRITIQGRLTKDPEVKTTANQTAYCNFSLACERNFAGQDGNRETDFIPCIAWKQRATFIGQHFRKGDMFLVSGALQSRSYTDNNGQAKKIYEVLVDEINFCGGNKPEAKSQEQHQIPNAPLEPLPEDDLPFEV